MNEDVIRDLYKNQLHFSQPLSDGSSTTVSNASCGDDVQLSVEINDGKIVKATFSGSACSITQASAEFLCRSIEGKALSEVDADVSEKECLTAFDMLTKERRVLCAILPYRALRELQLAKQKI